MMKSLHFLNRSQQRNINKLMTEAVVVFGERHGENKIILDRKSAVKLLESLNEWKNALEKIAKRGGVTVVADGDTLITAHRFEGRRNK